MRYLLWLINPALECSEIRLRLSLLGSSGGWVVVLRLFNQSLSQCAGNVTIAAAFHLDHSIGHRMHNCGGLKR